jgi:hypothetical protein
MGANPSIERTASSRLRRLESAAHVERLASNQREVRMSWDVSIHKFSKVYRDVEDIPQDEVPCALGSRNFVHERVLAEFPGTDWSDPSWGVWGGPEGSIEFNLGKEEPANGLMLHVRASPQVVAAIVRLCSANGWQGIDCSSGQFIEQSNNPSEGLEAWSAYRDQIVRSSGRDA